MFGQQTANAAGAAYIYIHNAGAWDQLDYLNASNANVDDEFGFSVAISGDTLAVGAKRE